MHTEQYDVESSRSHAILDQARGIGSRKTRALDVVLGRLDVGLEDVSSVEVGWWRRRRTDLLVFFVG